MLAKTGHQALIVVDMQNDFVRVGAPMEVPSSRAIIPAITSLIKAFRAANLPVAFTRYISARDHRHLQTRLPWLRLIEPPICACVPGYMREYADVNGPRDAAGIVDELAPRPSEIVVDKTFFSAFFGTDLHARLQSLGVDTVFVTGTLTEMCVEDTARHSVHHGYRTDLVRDAIASNAPLRHDATLTSFAANYGQVVNACELLSYLAESYGQSHD